MLNKTGECYYRDKEGNLWLAETFIDSEGVTTTKETLVEEE